MTQLNPFPSCGPSPIGFYPIVDSSEWVARLLAQGVSTIQLRIKNKPLAFIEHEVIKSVEIAKPFNARLFINDYWDLAIKHGAYGLHVGQEDLIDCPVEKVKVAGLRLGISTHCFTEVDIALRVNPSYLAYGPVYPTTSKPMPYVPQGLSQLKIWAERLSIPLVAIGGISLARLAAVKATGVDGIAVISAVTEADDVERVVQKFLQSYKL